MTHRRIYSIVLLLIVTSGCSAQTPQTSDSESETMSTTETDSIVKSPDETIEFEPTRRKAPETAQEAMEMLEQMRRLYDSSNVPEPLNQELTRETVYETAKALVLIQRQLPHDLDWLRALEGDTISGGDQFETQRIDNAKASLLSRLNDYLPKELDFTVTHSVNHINNSVDRLYWQHIEKAASVDLKDQAMLRNKFGNELLNQSISEQINRLDATFQAGMIFEQLLGEELDLADQYREFREVVDRYQERLAQAADAIQLPEDIGNSDLTRIAEQVFADTQRAPSQPLRIVVNAGKRSYSKDHYLVDFSERAVTKSPYRWEEFQVCTVEQEGDRYFLYYNTLINYSVGPHTVPVGKWIIGHRHKSSPISESNFR